MKENFPLSLTFVLKDEGGNDDDPADHGGYQDVIVATYNFPAEALFAGGYFHLG